MSISERDISEIKSRTDITDLVGDRVTLRRKGRLYWGCCPFHKEKTPSFKVDPETGLYHCFGCGESGDCYTFLMKLDGLEFVEAARLLADRAHYEIQEEARPGRGIGRNRLMDAHRLAQTFYAKRLLTSPDAARARDYLASRGFHSDVAKRFGLGWAPGGAALVTALTKQQISTEELVAAGLAVKTDGGRIADRFRSRVMFPIADASGRVIAFGGRVIDDGQPKYLNSADSPIFSKGRVLYALDRAKRTIQAEKTAVIVEGYTDVIAAHTAGLENVVATLGTAFTEDHLRLLGRFADTVILVFDADAAGMAAAERGLKFASAYGVPAAGVVAKVVDQGKVDVRVAVLPEGKDPADVLAKGPDSFTQALAASEPLIDFAIERRLAAHHPSSLAGRLEAAREALGIIAAIESAPARDEYLERLATRLHLEMHALKQELARLGRAAPKGERPSSHAGPAARPASPGVSRTPELVAEGQALTALLHRRELLGQYAESLGPELFSTPATRQVFETLEADGPEGSESGLMSALAGRPEATEVLASSLLAEEDAVSLSENFADILGRLKEFALGRQIDDVSARLTAAERAGEPVEPIQSELWELQRERHRWRKATPAGA